MLRVACPPVAQCARVPACPRAGVGGRLALGLAAGRVDWAGRAWHAQDVPAAPAAGGRQ